MFTFLAIVFIVLLVVVVFYGFGIVMKRPPTMDELAAETCSLCKKSYDKTLLVERQVGDSRLYFFCHDCIEQLHKDSQLIAQSRP